MRLPHKRLQEAMRMTLQEGQCVSYFHAMLDKRISGKVLRVTKRGIVVELNLPKPLEPAKRFLTYRQAEERLTEV